MITNTTRKQRNKKGLQACQLEAHRKSHLLWGIESKAEEQLLLEISGGGSQKALKFICKWTSEKFSDLESRTENTPAPRLIALCRGLRGRKNFPGLRLVAVQVTESSEKG